MTHTLQTFAVPRIRTERLLLREPQERDFDAWAAHVEDEESTRYTSGVLDRRSAWRFFLMSAGSWIVNGGGWWVAEETATGTPVGKVGAFFRESMIDLPPRERSLELGWTFFKAHWGRGFATEGAAAALAWATARHDPARVIAHVAKENTASVSVANKLGMRLEGDVDFYGEPVQLFVIDRRAAADPCA